MHKRMMVLVSFVAALVVFTTPTAQAQITVPNTLQAGAVIRAAELNTNFSTIADKALNRITGGSLEGNLTLSTDVTIDGVDLSDFLLSTGEVRAQNGGVVGGPAFAPATDDDTGLYFPDAGALAFSLDGTQRFLLDSNGLTVFGVNIINSDGKIPALTSTYFASLAGGNLTALNATQLTSGTVPDARLSSNVALRSTSNTFTVSGTPVTLRPSSDPSAGTKVLDSQLADGTSKFSVDIEGDVVANSLHTSGIRLGTSTTLGYVLTADASGNGTWQSPGVATGAVPSGMIAIFDTACPATWSHVSVLDNKFIRGGSTYDADGGGQDTHSHTTSYFPGETVWSTNNGGAHTPTIQSGGAHSHTVDIASTSTSSSGSHAHDVSGTTSSGGSHSHTGTTTTNGEHNHATGGAQSGVGAGNAAVNAGDHNHSFTTSSSGTHSHSFSDTTNSGGSHTHTVDPVATSTSTSSTHSHTADAVAAHSHGFEFPEMPTDSASNVPSYVQVVFCKKD